MSASSCSTTATQTSQVRSEQHLSLQYGYSLTAAERINGGTASCSKRQAVLPNAVHLFPLAVKRGDRIAQLILERIAIADIEEVGDLEDTARGAGGFGSTGVSGGAGAAAAPGEAKRPRTEE